MILTLLKRAFQMLTLLALQILILNHVSFWGIGTPMIGVLLLAYLPMNTSHTATMIWGFLMGLITDIFANTPGMGSAAMTLTALLHSFLLHLQAPKDAPENMVPTYHTMGTWNHIRFVFTLFLTHHFIYFVLESFSCDHVIQTAIHFLASLLTSLSLAYALETLRTSHK